MFKIFGILCFLLNLSICSPFPKIIWVYWYNGLSNAPLMTKMCVTNIQNKAKNAGWQFREINSSNENYWIKDYAHFVDYFEKKRVLNTQHEFQLRSDYVRLHLLKQYGGLWLDANIILIEGFEWIDKIKNDPNVINKYSSTVDALFFHQDIFGSNQITQLKSGVTVQTYPGEQSWFIAAIPNAQIIKDWLVIFQNYLLIGQPAMAEICEKYTDKTMNSLYKSYYHAIYIALFNTVMNKQEQLDKRVFKQGYKRQFAVHYYRMWSIDSITGPFKLHKLYGKLNYGYLISNLMLKTREQTESESGKLRYMIKFTGDFYKRFEALQKKNRPIDDLLFSVCNGISLFYCNGINFKNKFKIRKNSIVHKELVQGRQLELQFPITDENLNLDDICQPSIQFIVIILFCLIVPIMTYLYIKYLSMITKPLQIMII